MRLKFGGNELITWVISSMIHMFPMQSLWTFMRNWCLINHHVDWYSLKNWCWHLMLSWWQKELDNWKRSFWLAISFFTLSLFSFLQISIPFLNFFKGIFVCGCVCTYVYSYLNFLFYFLFFLLLWFTVFRIFFFLIFLFNALPGFHCFQFLPLQITLRSRSALLSFHFGGYVGLHIPFHLICKTSSAISTMFK